MIRIHLADCLGLPVPCRMWSYELAGHGFTCDAALEMLEPYRLREPGPAPAADTPASFPKVGKCVCRSAKGWLGGKIREVAGRSWEGGLEIDISGIGRFGVTAPEGHICCLSLEEGVARKTFEEVLLGPPIALSLACRDVWCLHTSAVNLGGDAVLFLGDSGEGKSTLAQHLAGHPEFSWVADDILPCAMVDGAPCARPHFPQLKVLPGAKSWKEPPEKLPMKAMYTLHPLQAGEPDGVSVQPCSPSRATLSLVRHSVASRLFSPPLLDCHLGFCSDVAGRVPVRRLEYPKRREWLPKICDAILADLG